MIEFSTLSDYLFLLRGVAESLAPHGPTVMLYLAAAVSDFYIPPQDMVGHIQFICFWKASLSCIPCKQFGWSRHSRAHPGNQLLAWY